MFYAIAILLFFDIKTALHGKMNKCIYRVPPYKIHIPSHNFLNFVHQTERPRNFHAHLVMLFYTPPKLCLKR